MSRPVIVMAALLVVVGACAPAPPDAKETSIIGVVATEDGRVVPDATVVISVSGGKDVRISTDRAGRYELRKLEPGHRYSVRAEFENLMTASTYVWLAPGQIARVDLPMHMTIPEIMWAPPSDLDGYWREADVVVRVRVRRTTEFIGGGWTDTVDVLDVLKPHHSISGAPMAFWQDWSTHEGEPYQAGQEMVLFLKLWNGRFRRVSGPFGVFFVRDGRVTHPAGGVPSFTPDVKVEDFLTQLRALGK
jgi:Carboxypeptidase regulatory-like domain